MRIGISGASGLVGSLLTDRARERGWEVVPLVRRREQEGIYWSIPDQVVDLEGLEGLDALVHLAGENLGGRRWTEGQKARILNSRVEGTTLLAEALGELRQPPATFLSASAVGYYGDTGDEGVDEESSAGEGFLAEVCEAWEESADRAIESGARVVKARFGVILSKEGGALERMLTPFRLGIGGRLGGGNQYMSWIGHEDTVRALLFLLDTEALSGAVNVTSPQPVRNSELTKALGEALGRPTILPLPGPVLKVVLGSELAEEMLLQGQRVRPTKLLKAGFTFRAPGIEEGLKSALEDHGES